MAANIIGVLEQVLGSNEVLSRLGWLIGLSPERTRPAIGGRSAGDPGGAGWPCAEARGPRPACRDATQTGIPAYSTT
jgi:hypothetical protein